MIVVRIPAREHVNGPQRNRTMKNLFRFLLTPASGAMLLGMLIGCGNPVQESERQAGGDRPEIRKPTPEIPLDPDTRRANGILEEIRKRDPKSLYTADFTGAVPRGAGVLIIVHGGPDYELRGMSSFEYLKAPAPGNAYARVLVKQDQMTPGRVPEAAGITEARAEEINLHSAATIFATAEHFAKKGHRVTLYASSFGAFLAAETIRRYGHTPFNSILIARGRLDMEKEVTEAAFKGIKKWFMDGVTIVGPLCGGPEAPSVNREFSRLLLQADLKQHRYSQLIPEDALSKMIYYTGGKDTRVGRLTEEEVTFLTGRSLTGIGGSSPGFSTKQVNPRILFHESIDLRLGASKPCTKIVFLIRRVMRTFHVIQGIPGRGTVKYAPADDHNLPSFTEEEIHRDIIESFGG